MNFSHDCMNKICSYSIRHGRFGFWYETDDGANFTVVAGATRHEQVRSFKLIILFLQPFFEVFFTTEFVCSQNKR